MSTTAGCRPEAWPILERALTEKRPVRVSYHGHERVLSPHVLGWKNGRAKVLAYQADGTTSHGALPNNTRQRWRSLFIDEIENPEITDDRWESADNYTPDTNAIDHLELAVRLSPNSANS